MNHAIQKIAITAMVMIAALLANLTYVHVFQADELRADPRNSRILLDEYARQRGQITAGSSVLALSTQTDGRFKFARSYPTAPMAFGPVTGYYSLQYATSAIEQSQDSILNGSDDRLFSDRITGLIAGRTPQGGNVELTLDPAVQQAAYDALIRGAGQGPFIGAVAAVKPSDGRIVALASSPSFDPNALSSQDPSERSAAMAQLGDNPGEPLLNHATQQTLQPGSTMKVITAAAALEEGMTGDTAVTGADQILLPGTEMYLTNYDSQSCGGAQTTLAVAFELSCNTAFVELSQKLGTDKFVEMAAAFGLDGKKEESFPLPFAASTTGDIDDAASLAMAAIGQKNVRVTALQNAMVAATVANNGVRMRPQLISALRAPDLSLISGFQSETAGRAISESTASQLEQLMLRAEGHAASSTGGRTKVAIASKTGTAERGVDPANTPPYTWYIAFAPDHDIAVAVMIESGPGITTGTVGATYAGPIGREVISAAVKSGGQR